MSRERTGSLWRDKKTKDLYGRITWVDSRGKLRDRKRKSLSGTKREARGHIRELLDELEEQGSENAIDGATMTFKTLADYFKAHYAIEAEYDRHGIKQAGMRSHRDAQRKLEILSRHFGQIKVKDINYGDLSLFKAKRLRAPVIVRKAKKKGEKPETRPRSIATVHRELALLRRVLVVAVRHRWLRRSPFADGDPLINPAEEIPRERIASQGEEDLLLAACNDDERRRHLRPFLVCAFDTGFRAGEIYAIRVCDVDFTDNAITVISYKGKRRLERQFDMTKRLRIEMEKLCDGKQPSESVFEFKSIKRSFATAKRVAGLIGFRLHDVRHTATTRLVRRGMSLEEAGKLMGHTQPKTTWRYMHADKNSRRRAAELLEEKD